MSRPQTNVEERPFLRAAGLVAGGLILVVAEL
jgi:hypothetical protein